MVTNGRTLTGRAADRRTVSPGSGPSAVQEGFFSHQTSEMLKTHEMAFFLFDVFLIDQVELLH